MKVIPLGDRIVVKRIEPAETTEGGIVLPDTAREKPAEGRVLSVGDGKQLSNGQRIKSQVHDGDRVLFGSYAGNDINIDGEDLLIMSESDVLAILE